MDLDEAIAHLLERKKKWYMHKISWSRTDVEAIIAVTDSASRPIKDDYRRARGTLPWRDGDELPEDTIR